MNAVVQTTQQLEALLKSHFFVIDLDLKTSARELSLLLLSPENGVHRVRFEGVRAFEITSHDETLGDERSEIVDFQLSDNRLFLHTYSQEISFSFQNILSS
jgi:hypothetical protein